MTESSENLKYIVRTTTKNILTKAKELFKFATVNAWLIKIEVKVRNQVWLIMYDYSGHLL